MTATAEQQVFATPEATAVVSVGRLARLRRWGNVPPGAGRDPASGAAAVFSARQRLWLLAGFVLLLMLRLPMAWWHGRFQDEEARVFLGFAWHHPAREALWRSFAGYLNLGANASTLALAKLLRAGILPMELAPRFTMVIATLFQTLPAVLILAGRGAWLANRWAVIAALLMIGITPMSEEILANVLHIQFHLALCCALILALDMPLSRRWRIACWLPLALAPLCGPGAIVLLPLFALRAALDRDAARAGQALALAAGAAVQMLVFYTHSPVRGQFLDPVTLINVMFLRVGVVAFLSRPGASFFGKHFYWAHQAAGLGWWAATALSLAYFAWLLVTAWRGGRRDAGFWLILTSLCVATVTMGAGMLLCDPSQWFSVGAGERYNFIPLALLGLGLVAVMRRGGRHAIVCRNLCALMVVSGLYSMAKPIEPLRNGADWPSEVARWRQNHDYQPAVWPKEWRADLSDHDRPCSPRGTKLLPADEPTYCEGTWVALVLRDSHSKAWVNKAVNKGR